VVPVPHINGTRNPVPVAILQKINSGFHSENQIQFQSGSHFFKSGSDFGSENQT
jgi:hypothetical protein